MTSRQKYALFLAVANIVDANFFDDQNQKRQNQQRYDEEQRRSDVMTSAPDKVLPQ